MNLNEAQKQTVAAWVAEGLKPADIQKRLETELGLRITYLEVRFLLDDLKLKPKDREPAKPAEPHTAKPQPPSPSAVTEPSADPLPEKVADMPATGPGPAGKVSVSVDQITRPGAMVSGKVTFSDGKSADWYLDQMGRLGLATQDKGYRPSQDDVMAFQQELQNALARMGF